VLSQVKLNRAAEECAHIYALLRAPMRRRRGSTLNFSVAVLFIGGVGITRNHTCLPRRPRRRLVRYFYDRAGIRVRHGDLSLSKSLGGGACVDVIFCEGGPPRGGPAYCEY